MQVAYKNIREQLIALTIDIEDKSKLCGVLERKADGERMALSRVEDNMKESYQRILEEQAQDHQHVMAKLINEVNELVKQKRDLIDHCRQLVDSLKEKEKDVAEECRKINKDVDDTIEMDRKVFRAAQEERLQKYLSLKMQEYKESTELALQPEIRRLKLMNERELLEVEERGISEEKLLRQSFQDRLQQLTKELEDDHRTQLRTQVQTHTDKASNEYDGFSRDQRMRLASLQHELEVSLEGYKRSLSMKQERERQEGREKMREYEESVAQRVREQREKNKKEIEVLQLDHAAQLKDLKKNSDKIKTHLYQKYEREIQKLFPGPSSSSSSSSPSKQQQQQQQASLDDSFNSESAGNKKLGSSSSSSSSSPLHSPKKKKGEKGVGSLLSIKSPKHSSSCSGSGGAAANSTVTSSSSSSAITNEFREERDKQIQSHIRLLQSETIKLERQWRERNEQARTSILEAKNKEESECVRKQRLLTDEISQLAIDRESLAVQVRHQQQRVDTTETELKTIKHEIEVFEAGIGVQRARLRDLATCSEKRERDETNALKREIDELNSELDSCEDRMQRAQREHDLEVKRFRSLREETFEALNDKVKRDVADRNADIEEVTDAIRTEEIKLEKLNNLIKQYSSSGGGTISTTTRAAPPPYKGGGGGAAASSATAGTSSGGGKTSRSCAAITTTTAASAAVTSNNRGGGGGDEEGATSNSSSSNSGAAVAGTARAAWSS